MIIALYGASGFQAGLVAAELRRRALTPILVGRDRQRLQAAADRLGLPDAGLREADTTHPTALTAAFRGCDVVINCAGPFTLSGAAVVAAAIEAGAHYVDTSGEQAYVKSIFGTFSDAAERAAVAVVPAATDAGIPGDLVGRLLGEQLGGIRRIAVSHLIHGGGGPSRGSLRSAMATFDAFTGGGLIYDRGRWRSTDRPAEIDLVPPGGTRSIKMAQLPLVEVITIPRHVRVEHVAGFAEASLAARLGAPLTEETIAALPEGPSEQSRGTQRFTYLIDATTEDGRSGRGAIWGADTYGTTAVIAAEAAIRLTANRAVGVLAPSQAFDPTSFLASLAPHGLSWEVTVGGE